MKTSPHTLESIMALARDLGGAHAKWAGNANVLISEITTREYALRLAVSEVLQDRDEWKSAAYAATELARSNYERAEKAERRQQAEPCKYCSAPSGQACVNYPRKRCRK